MKYLVESTTTHVLQIAFDTEDSWFSFAIYNERDPNYEFKEAITFDITSLDEIMEVLSRIKQYHE